MKLKRTSRLLALLLAAVMVMSLLPGVAMAAPDGSSEIVEIDIAAENEKVGEDNYGDSVYLITAPEGTTQVKFVSSSDNEISAIHDFYYTTAITAQPIALSEAYIVTIEGLNANCGGYGFEDVYMDLPEGTYYGFSIDDREGTYPYFLISIEEAATGTTKSYSLDAGGVTITYSAAKEGSAQKIGSFVETTMAGYTGDVYLASLPYGAEIKAIACPLSYCDDTTDLTHNYFGSGSMCLMYDSDALVTIQDELIYDDQFTDADFIAAHTFGYDGYGDLYSWITFTEDLPSEDVKGFAVYDGDFGTWAGEGGAIVFIQISVTKEPSPISPPISDTFTVTNDLTSSVFVNQNCNVSIGILDYSFYDRFSSNGSLDPNAIDYSSIQKELPLHKDTVPGDY